VVRARIRRNAPHVLVLAYTLLLIAACSNHDATAPVVGAASKMSVVGGNNQFAPAGSLLPQLVQFKLEDRNGNGIPNAMVTIQVSAGEGSLAGGVAVALTDELGVAHAPAWTLGKLAIPQSLRATAGVISDSATATVSTQFHAEVRFFGAQLNPDYLPAFTRGISRLNAEVVGLLTPVTLANQNVASDCGVVGVAPLTGQIESLVIYATVGPLDGPGGMAASSGPCYVRQSNKLTIVGTMRFDEADLPTVLANSQLSDVVFHEMQHVLGFGTLWTTVTPSLVVNPGTSLSGFIGANAIRGCQQAGGTPSDCVPSIPLETAGGSGTADGHWRQSIFGNELMTGSIAPAGTAKPLSAMTIGSITDLGYQTNVAVADSYAIPSAVAALLDAVRSRNGPDSSEFRDTVLAPRFEVTTSGSIRRIRQNACVRNDGSRPKNAPNSCEHGITQRSCFQVCPP
jgi:hypothetical protein